MSQIIRRKDTTPTEHAQAAPWLESIEVPPSAKWLFISGQVPPIINSDVDIEDRAAYGDMETQTRGVLLRIEQKLKTAGFSLGDIVKMTVFLVAESKNQKVDLDGFGRAYRDFFGTIAQPNLHTRSRIQVVQLMNPAWLVEIEVIAARV
ncbi:MAG: RidA family protein [Taibaiella sp.]|jgi:enamine deaminase RidA (YjgF/YER057c/UK114 family)